MTPMAETALLLVDLQNDFIHPEGAYGRAGQSAPEIAALPARLKPLAELMRAKGGWIVATQFTLVPAKNQILISPHLQKLRPFFERRDFEPGSWVTGWSTSFSRRTSRSRRSPIRPST